MDKTKVLDVILDTKVIAVIRMSDARRLDQVAESLLAGGVKVLEITMTTPGALETIAALAARNDKRDIIIGARTVLDRDTAEAAIRAGANFLVSPITDRGMIAACRHHGRLVAPGAFTPTEIVAAWEEGADIVKIFPSTSLGPAFFKDIRGPLPHIRLMPTGGVNLENARDFIRKGACCVGIGTALLDTKAIADGTWDLLTQKAKTLIESVKAT
jgi:2-dehydro-3-deoxyphosphogluconate aldolase / (4S)-4-hydroxy-2-oxoglutarate aldolase